MQDSPQSIPQDIAYQLCADICQENRGKWFSPAAWQCWDCVRFTGGDPAKMCLNGQPGFRGCNLVNARYDRQKR